MKIINLFGGPGSGKSTTAAGVFHLLKLKSISCELVTEYAKVLAWENDIKKLNNQLYITAKQNLSLDRLIGKVDYVVTDSPILIGLAYCENYKLKAMKPLIVELFNTYNNVNFFIKRKKNYHKIGRMQNETEARDIDLIIKNLLTELNIEYFEIDNYEKAPQEILNKLNL